MKGSRDFPRDLVSFGLQNPTGRGAVTCIENTAAKKAVKSPTLRDKTPQVFNLACM